MSDPNSFLASMAALSSAVQTFVDHVIKRRWTWLDTDVPNRAREEGWRQTVVHIVSSVVGGAVAYSVNLCPLAQLGLEGSKLTNAIAAGVLVSFGSSFFNEALDAVRGFKKAQEGVRQSQIKAGIVASRVTS